MTIDSYHSKLHSDVSTVVIKSFAVWIVAVGAYFLTSEAQSAPFKIQVSAVGLDGSNNVTSITAGPAVINPVNLTASTADLSNVSRVFNGTGIVPASVSEGQPYCGDLSLLTGFQDIGPTDNLFITFNAPINTVAGSGRVDFVLLHARAVPNGISF
jgi:hypothetical protein